MKITVLTENWNETGGIQNYLKNIVHGLEGRHEVTVIEPSTQKFYWPLVKPSWLPVLNRLKKQAKAGEIDVLICGKGLFEGLAGYYLKKKFNIPYLVFTYAMEIRTWAGNTKNKKNLNKALSNADQVFYINDVTKQEIIDLGASEENLTKLTPGVDQRHFNSVSDELVKSYLRHYGVQQPYILSVGRLVHRKGFDTLVSAFAKIDQVKFENLELVIVGNGPELGDLTELAENEWVGPSVKFLNDVPDKHMPALYAGAEVFSMTPKETDEDIEGFGIVYLEAAAHGIPTVATRSGGVPEAVVDGETGLLVNENDIPATTEALEKLLEDENLSEKLGSQAKKRAEQEFNWESRFEALNGILTKIQK